MDVLLPIKPVFVNLIRNSHKNRREGKNIPGKRREFRKRIPKKYQLGDRFFIYESFPTKRIVGYFRSHEITEDIPKKLWAKYHAESGLTEERFFKYFAGCAIGFAISIDELHFFPRPVDPNVYKKGYRGPQAYSYVDPALADIVLYYAYFRKK